MGIQDLFGKKLQSLASLLNLRVDKLEASSQKLEAKNVVTYNVTYNDNRQYVVQQHAPTALQGELEQFDKGHVLFVPERVVPTQIVQEANLQTKKEKLSFYKRYLPQKDLGCLALSLDAIYSEDMGVSADARKFREEIAKRYGLRGKQIYNFARAGFFEKEIPEKISLFKEDKTMTGLFLEGLWAAPQYIFLSYWKTKQDTLENLRSLVNQIHSRTIVVEQVYIYSRGDTLNRMLVEVCDSDVVRDNFASYKIHDYKLAGKPAKKAELMPKGT